MRHRFGRCQAQWTLWDGALYILQAIEARCVGLAFTNASPALPVWGGRTKFLGTGPFAAGAPAGDSSPFVLDMACSIVARGKLKFAAQRGEAIPQGLALDRQGRPTTNGAEGFDEILMPGEPEARKERERLTLGIPLTRDVFESLQSEGKRVGLPFPGR